MKFGRQGVVTQFATQFALQFTPDNMEPRTENKNLVLGNTVLKIWSLIWQKMNNMSIILVSLLLRNIISFFFFFELFFKVILWTKLAFFLPI